MTIDVRPRGGGVSFGVKAQPRAKRAGVIGEWNGCVRVAVREPAEGGRANAAILETIAGALGVRPAAVALVSGAASSRKVVAVEGVSAADAARRLAAASQGAL